MYSICKNQLKEYLQCVNQLDIHEHIQRYVTAENPTPDDANRIFFNFRVYPALHTIIMRKAINTTSNIDIVELIHNCYVRFLLALSGFRNKNHNANFVANWEQLFCGYFNRIKNFIVCDAIDSLYADSAISLDILIDNNASAYNQDNNQDPAQQQYLNQARAIINTMRQPLQRDTSYYTQADISVMLRYLLAKNKRKSRDKAILALETKHKLNIREIICDYAVNYQAKANNIVFIL